MDLERKAIERIHVASQMALSYYGKPLIVTDRGGKDSAVCRELVKRSGVPHEIMHNLTTADVIKKWTQRYRNWDQVLNQLIVLYGERITNYL